MLKREEIRPKTVDTVAEAPLGSGRAAQGSEAIAFNASEAARRCGIGRTFLYAAIAKGELKTSKIGRRRIITLAAIQAWIQGHEK